MNKILIIEDDIAHLKGIQSILEEDHYRIITETDGEKGYQRALQEKVDLILLDLMLPSKHGEEICQELRLKGNNTPIVILTAKDDEIDEITLLKIGADDFLTKPVTAAKLRARIQSVLRRIKNLASEIETFSFGEVHLDFRRQEVNKGEKKIVLSTREFAVLKYLIQHAEEVVTRDDLLDNVWEPDVCPTPRTVDNYILNLRKKLETDRDKPKHILTVPRAGYKFVKD